MALFTNEEKAFLQETLNLYLQLSQQKLPQNELERVVALAQGIANKIESGGEEVEKGGKPNNITDEWFENCCQKCEHLGAGGKCLDKITEKFPGKCDPIIMYEREKNSTN